MTGYGLDADKLIFLGYSNGANLLAAVILLHPGIVRRAVLLRGIQVLENPKSEDLSGTSVLILEGRDDIFARTPSTLADDLRARGAKVEPRNLSTDHKLSVGDITEATEWLRQNFFGAAPM